MDLKNIIKKLGNITDFANEIFVPNSTDIIWLMDLNISKKGINPLIITFLLNETNPNQIPINEHLKTESGEYVFDRLKDILTKELNGKSERGEKTEIQYIARDESGKEIWMLATVFFIYDATDKPAKMIGLSNKTSTEDSIEKTLNDKTEIETLIRKITDILLNTNDTTPIISGLSHIGRFFEVDRVSIFQFNEMTLSMTYEWCDSGIPEQSHFSKGINVKEKLPWLFKYSNDNKFDIIDLSKIPQAKEDLKTLLKSEISSVTWFPMIQNSSLLGFICFDTLLFQNEKIESNSKALKIIANIFSLFIGNNHNLKDGFS